MMLGVLAQRTRDTAEPPSGEMIASADFVNGIYSVGATSLTAADVVSDTGRISGSGLSIVASTPVQLLGDFLDTLLPADFTVVIEFTAVTPPQSGGHRLFLLTLWNASFGSLLAIYTGFLFPVIYDQNLAETPDDRTLFGDYDATAGTNKMAVTRTDDHLAVSINGSPINTDFTPLVPAVFVTGEIADHNGSGSSGYIRSIDVYAAQSDAALVTLSA